MNKFYVPTWSIFAGPVTFYEHQFFYYTCLCKNCNLTCVLATMGLLYSVDWTRGLVHNRKLDIIHVEYQEVYKCSTLVVYILLVTIKITV